MSEDPLGYVDGYNLYQYALNNPLRYTDPMGTTSRSLVNSGVTTTANNIYTHTRDSSIASQPVGYQPASTTNHTTFTGSDTGGHHTTYIGGSADNNTQPVSPANVSNPNPPKPEIVAVVNPVEELNNSLGYADSIGATAREAVNNNLLSSPESPSIFSRIFDRVATAHEHFRSGINVNFGFGIGLQPRVKLGPVEAKTGAKAVIRGEANLSPNLSGRIQADAAVAEVSAFKRFKAGFSSDQFNLVIDEGKVTKSFKQGVIAYGVAPNNNVDVKPYEVSIGGTFFVLDAELSVDYQKIYESYRILFTGK